MQEECAVWLWGGGRKYTEGIEAGPSCPSSAPSRSPAPQPSFAAGQDQGEGCRAPAPFLAPGPRLPLPGRLPLGTPPGAGPLPRPGASVPTRNLKFPRKNEPPPRSRRTPSVPLRVSPTLSSPAGHHSPGLAPASPPARLPCTHRRAALGAPA